MDRLRDFLEAEHPEIALEEFPYYSLSVFNECENGSKLLLAAGGWDDVHPFLDLVPVDWDYTMPFGILHAPIPSPAVRRFLQAVKEILDL